MGGALVTSILLGSVATLPAGTTPFFDSFDSYSLPGDPTPTGFTEETSGQWTVQTAGGGQDYQNDISATGSMFSALSVTSSSGVGFPALPGNAFTMSTNFTVDTLLVSGSPLSTAFVGFAVLATDPNYAFTSNPRYQVSYVLDDDGTNPTGKLVLSEFNTGDNPLMQPPLQRARRDRDSLHADCQRQLQRRQFDAQRDAFEHGRFDLSFRCRYRRCANRHELRLPRPGVCDRCRRCFFAECRLRQLQRRA